MTREERTDEGVVVGLRSAFVGPFHPRDRPRRPLAAFYFAPRAKKQSLGFIRGMAAAILLGTVAPVRRCRRRALRSREVLR
ncbi:MAG: hypothetical protein BGO98_49725 [Myxococcales bacterium 68-20]|nr:MAG: hypothetical protein BGO98_49725 [Myxococcales bacterium 68-20]